MAAATGRFPVMIFGMRLVSSLVNLCCGSVSPGFRTLVLCSVPSSCERSVEVQLVFGCVDVCFHLLKVRNFVVDVVFQVLRRFDPMLVFDCRYSFLQQYGSNWLRLDVFYPPLVQPFSVWPLCIFEVESI